MERNTRLTSKRVLQLSELMIVLVGLLSVCYPGHLKHAQVPHRAPVSSNRPHSSRTRPGSSRTSADAHAEPEMLATDGELRNGTVPDQRAVSSQAANVHQPNLLSYAAHAAFVLLDRGVSQALAVCGRCVERDERSLVLADIPLPRLGRAPPVLLTA